MRSLIKDLLIGLLVAIMLFGAMTISAKIVLQSKKMYLQSDQQIDRDSIFDKIQDWLEKRRESIKD